MNQEIVALSERLRTSASFFTDMMDDDCLYVDKTMYIYNMVGKGAEKAYFLSRPRRFGKSLLLSTIEALFQGKESLFHGLYIHDKWDWSQTFPVIRLDMSSVTGNTPELLAERLKSRVELVINRDYPGKITLTPGADPSGAFEELIYKLYDRCKKPIVVLIDEYDIPIISNVLSPDAADMAKKVMHSFYTMLKANDRYIRFVMLTGISKFSGVSVFSGFNNLVDISLNPSYSAICGYTEAELDMYFAPFMNVIDREAFRRMYNGYNWLGEPVYNPVDVMRAIKDAVAFNRLDRFDSYWFTTGTPTFLAELMKERGILIPSLAKEGLEKTLFSEISVDDLFVEGVLFQTGYLTIDRYEYNPELGTDLYYLKFPNKEVEMSYNSFFLKEVFRNKEKVAYLKLENRLSIALSCADFNAIFTEIHRFFASLSHRWYTKNKIASAEGFYCMILYSILKSRCSEVEVESQTNHGQIDLFVRMGINRYLIEVKVWKKDLGVSGLAQIRAKGYAQKYMDDGHLYLVGMAFSEEERNIVEMECCLGVGGEIVRIAPDLTPDAFT